MMRTAANLTRKKRNVAETVWMGGGGMDMKWWKVRKCSQKELYIQTEKDDRE